MESPIIPIFALHFAAAAAYAAAPRFFAAAAAAAVLHAATLWVALSPQWQPGLGAVVSLFMLATYAMAWKTLRFARARKLLAGFAAAAMFLPLFLPPQESTPAFTPHAVLAILSYAAYAGAFLHWLELRAAERLLRNNPQMVFSPPLLNGELWCFRYTAAAFALLTLTLASGLADAPGGFAFTHKNIFAVLTWLTFLALLLGRKIFGWRGNTAQWWFFAGYAFLLLSYIGSTFVVQVILERG